MGSIYFQPLPMASERPPTIAPAAAARWQHAAPAASPWLHEEVGKRMQDRLQWIKSSPAGWGDWEPVRGGLAAHASVAQRYPQARVHVVEPEPARAAVARARLAPQGWRRLLPPPLGQGRGGGTQFGALLAGAVQLLWANMHLHMVADPEALLRTWYDALAVDGFLMFSCLGPDTVRELRALYAALGWPPPAHEFTDMHDWGDLLVNTGFAEPVMDMERITLAFDTPQRLLQELRELGANPHRDRFPALRGRGWRAALEQALEGLRAADGRLALTFEVVYGHAFKPLPRIRPGEATSVSMADMRAMLKKDRGGR
jgi:malonyl-CoA O-methyltransferase